MGNTKPVGVAYSDPDLESATISGSLTVAGNEISGTEFGYLDGLTAGTVTASKAVVVDANKDIASFRNLTVTGNIVTGATTLSETDLAKIDGITNGTQAAGKAVVADANVNIGAVKATSLSIGTSGAEVALAATVAELNQAADISAQNTMAAGVGFAGTGTLYKPAVVKHGDIIETRILIDLTGTQSSTTDLDIIGNSGVSHIGQITAALNGTILGGTMTCLEAPTGGIADIDLYFATEGTGAFDGAIGDLAETALITAGGNWTLGLVKPIAADPAANSYLYLTSGAGGTAAAYTAGRFLIKLFGY